jgi:hypothetical protein
MVLSTSDKDSIPNLHVRCGKIILYIRRKTTRHGPTCLRPHRERRGTLVSKRNSSVLLGRSGSAYDGSDKRLGGRTAVMTLSIWLGGTNARVGLLRE